MQDLRRKQGFVSKKPSGEEKSRVVFPLSLSLSLFFSTNTLSLSSLFLLYMYLTHSLFSLSLSFSHTHTLSLMLLQCYSLSLSILLLRMPSLPLSQLYPQSFFSLEMKGEAILLCLCFFLPSRLLTTQISFYKSKCRVKPTERRKEGERE